MDDCLLSCLETREHCALNFLQVDSRRACMFLASFLCASRCKKCWSGVYGRLVGWQVGNGFQNKKKEKMKGKGRVGIVRQKSIVETPGISTCATVLGQRSIESDEICWLAGCLDCKAGPGDASGIEVDGFVVEIMLENEVINQSQEYTPDKLPRVINRNLCARLFGL